MTPQPDTQAPHVARMARPWWRPGVSLVALTALLIVVAAFIPQGAIDTTRAILGQAPQLTTDAFSAEVAALDAALTRGTGDLDAAALTRHRAELQLRWLLRTGPMHADEVARARAILVDANQAYDAEPLPGGKLALRHASARRLVAACPRLSYDAAAAALDAFDEAYAKALAPS